MLAWYYQSNFGLIFLKGSFMLKPPDEGTLKKYRFEDEGFFASTITRKIPLGQDCVTVRKTPDRIDVRDTKDPNSPTLSFTPSEWTAFIQGGEVG